jgi:hypothetical protein
MRYVIVKAYRFKHLTSLLASRDLSLPASDQYPFVKAPTELTHHLSPLKRRVLLSNDRSAGRDVHICDARDPITVLLEGCVPSTVLQTPTFYSMVESSIEKFLLPYDILPSRNVPLSWKILLPLKPEAPIS